VAKKKLPPRPTHATMSVRIPRSLEIRLLRVAAWAEVPVEDVIKVMLAMRVVADSDNSASGEGSSKGATGHEKN
jgi:hypothetical protein